MKKILSVLLLLCMVFLSTVALADPDEPFLEGIWYGEPFKGEYGAVPSMLNFGSTRRLGPGESLYDVNGAAIKSIKGTTLASNLSSKTYYCYAKWQCSRYVEYWDLDAMLVMTTPEGAYYATYSAWTVEDCGPKTVYSWFFDVTELLERCLEDNGSFSRGEYAFSLFLNNLSFRSVRVKVT